uniref:DDE_Tnp_1_7 domain-containing protein n=1 Tax=Strongyloides papillosus TaxID=174720 RepID=A0A0N5BTV0_STREA
MSSCSNVELSYVKLFYVELSRHHFNDTTYKLYNPSKNLSVDEAMLNFRGFVPYRQYIVNKKHAHGIKMYSLCEPTGLVLCLDFYMRRSKMNFEYAEIGHSGTVVLELLENYLYERRSVFIDNYYSSIVLAQILYQKKTFVTGTIRKNRKGVKDLLNEIKLSPGQKFTKIIKGMVEICYRNDKKDIYILSTEFSSHFADSKNSRGTVSKKPLSASSYNSLMVVLMLVIKR